MPRWTTLLLLKHHCLRLLQPIWCILLLLLLQQSVHGQGYDFRHYQVENGLSHNTVLCSLQDQKGFLWFGTKDGLNRFDGYAFKVFRKVAGQPGSLGNNNIHSLFEDKEGTLWVGTEKGLFQYLPHTEEFRLVAPTTGRYIDKMTEDQRGNLWFISNFELCRYARQEKALTVYNNQRFFVTTSLCASADGAIWATTSDGQLKKFDPRTGTFAGFDLFTHSNGQASRWLEHLYASAEGYLLAGTSDTEIKLIDPAKGTYTDITLPHSGQKNLYIRSILQTGPGTFWLGAESGLFIYNLNTKQCQHLEKDYSNPYSLNDNAIYTFCRDREGGIWVGTYFGGINYLPNQQSPFAKFYPQKGKNSLSGNVVREIKQDHFRNLWVGTEDAGLNKIDSKGRVTHFLPTGAPGGLSFFNIHGLFVNGDELWVGTFLHGLDVLDIRSGKVVRHYSAGAASGLTHDFIYSFYQNARGQIFVCTPHGVSAYNRAKDQFEPVNGLPYWNWYSAVLQDAKGRFWGATFGNGLHFLDLSTGKTATYRPVPGQPNSLGSDRVNAIFEDSQKQVWFATEEGLCRWNETTQNFTRYGTANGFPSDFILSLQEDAAQNLWISTTRGLVRFHPGSGKLQVFTTANGLLSDQFNYNSAFKDAGGQLYFGSTRGFVRFQPGELKQDRFESPVYLTGFQVNGQDAVIGGRGSPLARSILYTGAVTLNHRQSTFSVDFAALTFSAPELVDYAYRMDGLAKNWVRLKQIRRVDFLQLPPGRYTLRVKAFSNNGTGSREARLTVVILPPWWASSWARGSYLVVALLLGYFLVRLYHRRMELRNQRKFEILQMAQEKELLQSKIDFFTNVAHEIKTPLTIIKVPLKKIIRKAGHLPEIENSLKIMDRNTNRLIELTNQLLDFRQADLGKLQLLPERVNVTQVVAETCAGFDSLAEQNQVLLQVALPDEEIPATLDVDAFKKILYNLFSNAVKYAAGKVVVRLVPFFKDDRSFTLVVQNDGPPISEELREKIFEPFYRIRTTENKPGTGIGLALARTLTHLLKGQLTLEPTENGMIVFSLTLPVESPDTTGTPWLLSPVTAPNESTKT